MNVDLKGAASSCYIGIKRINKIIEDYNEQGGDIEDLIDLLEGEFVKHQVLFAAHSINNYFNGGKIANE